MSTLRHSPPPSAAAPRPKGILKNASDSFNGVPQDVASPPLTDENGNRLAWDESNLALHEIERETQAARMKIDEPKTPFVRSASLGPVDDDGGFDLDSKGWTLAGPPSFQRPSYFPDGSGASASTSSGSSPTYSFASGRRSSAAEQLAANTMANAGRRPSNAGSTASSGGGGQPNAAVGLDGTDLGATTSVVGSRRSDSRSPSFTLPSSRRSSAAGDRSREGVRKEMRDRDDAMEGVEQDEEAFEEDNEDLDPEAKAKQAAFAQKRNAHYGNEAEAMKVAAALAAEEDDDDDEEDEGGNAGHSSSQLHSNPPTATLPNGRAY